MRLQRLKKVLVGVVTTVALVISGGAGITSPISNVEAEGQEYYTITFENDLTKGTMEYYEQQYVEEYSTEKLVLKIPAGEKIPGSPFYFYSNPGYEYQGFKTAGDDTIYPAFNIYDINGTLSGITPTSDMTFQVEYKKYDYYKVNLHYEYPDELIATGNYANHVEERNSNVNGSVNHLNVIKAGFRERLSYDHYYTIDYWYTKDGSIKEYSDTLSSVDRDLDLYPKWITEKEVTDVDINYKGNGGVIKDGPGGLKEAITYTMSYGSDSNINIYNLAVEKENDTFLGWRIEGQDDKLYKSTTLSDGTYTGDVIKLDGNPITLLATWKSEGLFDESGEPIKEQDADQTNETTEPEKKEEAASGQSNDTAASSSSNNSTPTHQNEWVDGKWYDANGAQTYAGTISWEKDATGWWIADTTGWYPKSAWQKINGYWYYFGSSGYMATSEWVGGYWINSDGTCTYSGVGSWKKDSNGWWYEDSSGWYPSNMWQKIDGAWYYFESSGYMATNKKVDGYTLGADGKCK